jgi:hypothetical protein
MDLLAKLCLKHGKRFNCFLIYCLFHGSHFRAGLPDFSWFKIPKLGKIYQNTYWFIRQDSNSSNVNESQSQNECIGLFQAGYIHKKTDGALRNAQGNNNEKGVRKKSTS